MAYHGLALPTKTGEFVVTADIKAGFVARYPWADVERELALMHLWLVRHEKRRPKRIFMFIDRWMAKTKPINPGAAGPTRGPWNGARAVPHAPPAVAGTNNVTPIRSSAVTVRRDTPRAIGEIIKELRFQIGDKK